MIRRSLWFFLGILTFLKSPIALAIPFPEELLNALIMAEPGSVIEIPEGTFECDTPLSLSVDNVTVRGKGIDKSILLFGSQTTGAEGLMISSNHSTLEDFTIRNTKGDGIKWNSVDGITVRRMRVDWTEGPITSHGAYGFYPVLSRNILIEDSYASGALDSGIYVGQSESVIVRRNHVSKNIAGIEIENTEHADVYDNLVTQNTAGILVFNLPGLSRYGRYTRVFNNTLIANNAKNEAPIGNALSDVPGGTGLMIFANKNVEVFHNRFEDHHTAHIVLANYLLSQRPTDDKNYDPYPKSLFLYENTATGGGTNPQGGSSKLSQEFIAEVQRNFGLPFPSILYDGLVDEAKVLPQDEHICIQNNLGFNFLNVVAESRSLSPHECNLEKLSPVLL